MAANGPAAAACTNCATPSALHRLGVPCRQPRLHPAPPPHPQIKEQWRRLCKQHHPDLQVPACPLLLLPPLLLSKQHLLGRRLCASTACMASSRRNAVVQSQLCNQLPPSCMAQALPIQPLSHQPVVDPAYTLPLLHTVPALQPEHMRHQAEQYFKEISSAYRTLSSRELWGWGAGPPAANAHCWAASAPCRSAAVRIVAAGQLTSPVLARFDSSCPCSSLSALQAAHH